MRPEAKTPHNADLDKGELPAKKLPTVDSVRQAVGMNNNGPKIPTIKKTSVPVAGPTAPKKDAFNTGGANPASAAMAKKDVPMSDVDLNDGAPRPGTKMPKAGKKIPAPGSGGEILKKDFKDMDQKATAIQSKPAAPAPVKPEAKPLPKQHYDPVDSSKPTVRATANKQIAATQGARKAASVATIRQRANAIVNDMTQKIDRRQAQFQQAQAKNPVAKNEEGLEKAGIPTAPAAPKAPEAKAAAPAQTPPVVPTVKNPNVTPTGTPKKL